MSQPDEANPFRCRLCEGTCYNIDGSPIGVVFCYQVIEGKTTLARNIVLGAPMYNVHGVCLEALR